jgi:hypothetical protein
MSRNHPQNTDENIIDTASALELEQRVKESVLGIPNYWAMWAFSWLLFVVVAGWMKGSEVREKFVKAFFEIRESSI